MALTKNNHNALISLHIANIIRPIDKNYRQKSFIIEKISLIHFIVFFRKKQSICYFIPTFARYIILWNN